MVLLLFAAMAGPAWAQAPVASPPPPTVPAAAGDEAVIPPGMESLIGEMLGRGQALPGGCALSEGQIDRTAVRATYTCQEGKVVLELVHPNAAPAGGLRTQQFALAVTGGTAPAGFVDAVAERIRAREGEFAWKIIPAGGEAHGGRGLRAVLLIAGVTIVALLLLAAAIRAVQRRRGGGAT
jgi:hypothetical protein